MEWWVADRQGFEPWRRSPAYTLSRRAPSTTRPPVRERGFTQCKLGRQAQKPKFMPLVFLVFFVQVLQVLAENLRGF